MDPIKIDIDQQLIERVMKRYGFKTQRAAIDFALRRIDVKPMGREEVLAMRGTGWSGCLEKLRLYDL